MDAIALRRGLAGIALTLAAIAALAPAAPVDSRTSLVIESTIGASKIVLVNPGPVFVAPPGYIVSQ